MLLRSCLQHQLIVTLKTADDALDDSSGPSLARTRPIKFLPNYDALACHSHDSPQLWHLAGALGRADHVRSEGKADVTLPASWLIDTS